MNTNFYAGFGQREITPEKMTRLAGYDLRKEAAVGVHDPLFTRVVSMAEESLHTALLIEVDLLGTAVYLCQRIRSAVIRRLTGLLDLSPEAIQIGAIHTHAAPQSVFQAFDCYDDEYLDFIAECCAQAAEDAFHDLHPVRAAICENTMPGVGSFRDVSREEAGFSMPVKGLWLEALPDQDVEESQSAPVSPILVAHFACHPTVLNEQNLLISRDLVWGAEQVLKDQIAAWQAEGRPAPPMPRILWMNGACADISTRFTRQAATFEEAKRLGARLMGSFRYPQETEWAEKVSLTCQAETLAVPPAHFFTKEERQEILTYLTDKIDNCTDNARKREYEACRSVLKREHYGEGKGTVAQLSLIELTLEKPDPFSVSHRKVLTETLDILGIPFEYAQRDAVKLAGKISTMYGKRAWIRCYTEGYEGYLPSGRPLDRDSGYEDMASGYAAEAKTLLANAVLGLVQL